jgi:hypothetical protein
MPQNRAAPEEMPRKVGFSSSFLASIDCAQHVVWLGGIFDWIPVQMFLILRLCQGRRGSRVFLFVLCVLSNWTAVGMASCVDLYVYFHFGQFTVEE